MERSTANPQRAWRKSSKSGTGDNCVEGAPLGDDGPLGDGGWAVRDSKDPRGPELLFGRSEWGAFIDKVKAGHFDQ